MKLAISDNLMLRFYGLVLLIVTLNIWIPISGIVTIPLLWMAALCAAIVYHRRLKTATMSVEWIVKIWASLFFPKNSDPMVTNIGKIHWLILCILALFGVDALVTPIHIQMSSSPFEKSCWVLSFSIAVTATFVCTKYRLIKTTRDAKPIA